jgi:23S rRNA (pseudouridine1915-N3)-methyltransferase
MIFVCGDADGFSEKLRERVQQRMSLSAMTYSHELARVMLAEQIYRAFAILSGSPYPK